MGIHDTSYKVEEGKFGGEECYRLEIDHGVRITFDTVRSYGRTLTLHRDGRQKASIREERLSPEVKLELKKIMKEEDNE